MFDKILNPLKKFFVQGEGISTPSLVSANSIMQTVSDSVEDSYSLSQFSKSLYLFAGLSKITTVISGIEFHMLKILNTQGETERIENHDFLDILYKPNSYQTKNEFLETFAIHMKLSGEAFIKLLRDDGGNLIGWINVRPDIVDVEIKKTDNEIMELVYTVHKGNGQMETYTTKDMIHIKFADPTNPLRGAGVLKPILSRLTAEQKANQLQNTVFENNGRPDALIYVKGLTQKTQAEDIKKSFFNSFSGKNKDKRTAVLGSADDFKYEQLSFSQKEMDFIESMKFLRDDIALALGVPKSLMTSDDVNLANAESGMKQFMKFTIEPLARLFKESLNQYILLDEYNDTLILEHEDLIEDDRKMLMEELTAGIDKWITINEARTRMGLDPVDGGDSLYRQFGVIDVTNNTPTRVENVFKGRNWLFKKMQENERIEAKAIEILTRKRKKEFLTVPTAKYKNTYIKAMNSVTDSNIAYMKRETVKYFKEQKARVQEAIENTPDTEPLNLSVIFDVEKELKQTKNLARQTYPLMALRSGNTGLEPVKAFHKVDAFTISPELMKIIEARAIFFAEHVVGVTYSMIGQIMAEGLQEGYGRDVQARNIYNSFDDMTRVRAKRIAQTEGTNMSNTGLNQAFSESEVVTGKMWLTVGDGKVRDEHLANEAQGPIDKDIAFSSTEHYPAEKSVNCRCVIAPVVR